MLAPPTVLACASAMPNVPCAANDMPSYTATIHTETTLSEKTASVPEPSTLALMILGLGLLPLTRCFRRIVWKIRGQEFLTPNPGINLSPGWPG